MSDRQQPSDGEPGDAVLDPANGADREWPDEAKILPSEYLGDDTPKP